jgi:hypothetical protein
MKKSINIQQTENGTKYFNIYEIKAVTHDGEVIIYDRELNEKKAKETIDFIHEHMSNLYTGAFIREQPVWC